MENSFEDSLEGLLMLKLKLLYFIHLMWRGDSLEKTLMLGKIESRRRSRWQDEMVGWHHQLNGYEFEQTPGDSEGQGTLACCSPWSHKESDMTEQLNNNKYLHIHWEKKEGRQTHRYMYLRTDTFGEGSWESLGLQGDPTSPFWRRSALRFLWREWCWSWNSSTLATSCEELIHWKRLWCWEGLGAGGEGDDRGWDGWMASPTQWIWVWANSRR